MRHLPLLLAATALTACGGAPASKPAGPDLLIIARQALTFDDFGHVQPIGTGGDVAVAIEGGRITWMGRAAQAPKGAARIERFPSGTLVPGLVDAHGHLTGLGRSLERLDLRGASSAQAVADKVAAAARRQPGSGWILGRGWDQNLWPEKEFPTHTTLSEVVADRPVVLTRVDGHAIWVNAAALSAAGVTASTPDPEGGRVVRDGAGRPTGVLIDSAVELIRAHLPPPSEADLRRWTLRAVDACRRVGLTGMHDAGASAAEVAVYRALAAEGALGFRVHVMLDDNDEGIGPLIAQGPKQAPMVQVMGVKLFADGALGSRGAWLMAPYADADTHGIPILKGDALRRRVRRYAEAGFQIGVHGIGDAAVRDILDAYAQIPDVAARRFRLEHAQIVHPEDQARMAALKVIASMQPVHATSDMGWAEDRLGPTRVKHAYAWRTLTDLGVKLALGSDFPVESPDPMAGLYAAVTRRGAEGPAGGWYIEEALTPEEALYGFTGGAAYASFLEARRGKLEVGFDADITVLNGDPRQQGSLNTLKPMGVVIDGALYRPQASKLASRR